MRFVRPKTVFGRTFAVLLVAGVLTQIVIFALVMGPPPPPDSSQIFRHHLSRYLTYLAEDLAKHPERRGEILGPGLGAEARGAGAWHERPMPPSRRPPSAALPLRADKYGHYRVDVPVRTAEGDKPISFIVPRGPWSRDGTLGMWILCGILFIVFIVAALVVKRILSPIGTLSKAFEQVKGGKTDVSVAPESDDELGRLTQSFNEMAAAVHFLIRDKEQLFTELSHEFRAPIARAMAANALVEQQELREKIRRDLAELDSLIHALLTAARLEAGSAVSSRESIDLEDLLYSVRELFPKALHRVVVEPADPDLACDADPRSLAMLVRNLLENALKYSPPDRPVRLAAGTRDGRVFVSVRDEGSGISEEELAHVFEPFYRGADGRKIRQPGFGLGLSLCRRIARAHGGDLTVECAPGAGTAVTAWLPSAPAPAASRAA